MENETTETIENNVEEQKSEGVGKVTQEPIKNEDKVFTQAEFNAFEKKIKDKYAKKYEGIDLDGYNAWKESQKTAEEKQAEREKEYQRILQENETLKHTKAILEKGIDRKFVNFIAFEVSQQDGNFDENLDKYLAEHEEYTNDKPVATGTAVKGVNESKPNGVGSYLQNLHPELNFKN